MTNVNSFIDAALTDMSAAKNQFGYIASVVQKQPHASPLNRIALAYVQLDAQRRLDRAANREPRAKPEVLFNFIQNLSNRMCWNARRAYFALLKQQTGKEAESLDFTRAATRGVDATDDLPSIDNPAAGVDFSEDIVEEAGVPTTSLEHLPKVLMDDFFGLANVHSWLQTKMSYLTEVEELRLFADYRPPLEGTEVGTGNWELRHAADSFDEALAVMQTILTEMAEDEATETRSEAANISFAA